MTIGGGLVLGKLIQSAVKADKAIDVLGKVDNAGSSSGKAACVADDATLIVKTEGALENAPVKAKGEKEKFSEEFNDWFWGNDCGGKFIPDQTGTKYTGFLGKIPGLRKYKGIVINDDLIDGAPWFSRLDTATHEGFHAFIGNHLPSYSRLTYASCGKFQYGRVFWHIEEVTAYSAGRISSGRLHLIPVAPFEAFHNFGRAGIRDTLIGYTVIDGIT